MKHDEILKMLNGVQPSKNVFVYYVSFVQGLLQGRQSLVCGGLQKNLPWAKSSIIQSIHEIKNINDVQQLPDVLVEKVFSNYLVDELDKIYVEQILRLLVQGKATVNVNSVSVPVPAESVSPGDYPNWLEEQVPTRSFSTNILQLHPKQVVHYNTIRAEEFIGNLQELWETSTNKSINLEEEIQQDW